MRPRDLDFECFRLSGEVGTQLAGAKLAKDAESLVRACSTILAKQGPNACLLYLQSMNSRNDQKIKDRVTQLLNGISRVLSVMTDDGCEDPHAALTKMQGDLSTLLLARTLLAQYFTYLRYHLKAQGVDEAPTSKSPNHRRHLTEK